VQLSRQKLFNLDTDSHEERELLKT